MARKKQYDYLGTMEKLSENAYEAAKILEEIVADYSLEALEQKSGKIHELERASDAMIDELTNELYDAFITPIDREDILIISERLDDILDGIHAMTYLFENLVITEIRPETDKFTHLLSSATKGVHTAMQEFPKFKNSKTLKNMILKVNHVESEGDRLYSRLKKQLFSEETNVLEIIKWKEIYDRFESLLNDSEDAVDIIDGLIIKNT